MCVFVIAVSAVMGLGAFPASADGDFSDAVILPDGEGKFYIFTGSADGCRLFMCSEASGIAEKDCERIEAEGICADSSDVYLYRYYRHSLCVYGVLKKKSIVLDCLPIKQGHIAINGGFVYISDEEDNRQIKIFRSSGKFSSAFKTETEITALFSDREGDTVYAAVSGGVIDIGSGRSISCDVPEFPAVYNGGKYIDSCGDVFTFSGEDGFELVFSTGSTNACAKGGYIYYTENDAVIRKNTETGEEAVYIPEMNILQLSASGTSVAAITDSEVLFLHDDDFEAVKEVSEEASESEVQTSPEEISVRKEPKQETSKKETSKKETKQETSKKENIKKEASKPESKTKTPKKEASETSPAETEKPEIKEIPYDLSDGYVRIPSGTTVAAFRKAFPDGVSAGFTKNDGTAVERGKIGTDWTIEITDYSGTKEYTSVVIGEISGNGEINTADAEEIAEYLCDMREFSPAQLIAADMNHDDIIDIRDICRFQEVFYTSGKTVPKGSFE